MNLLHLVAPIAVLGAALSAQAEDAVKYDLKYKFKAGEIMRCEVVHQATVETTIQGTTQTAQTRSSSIKLWEIGDVKTDGSVTFTHMVENVEMWQQMQGRQEMRYNSLTDKKPPKEFEDAAKRVGVPLTVISMDARGNVVKREEKLDKLTTNPTPITMPMPGEAVPIGHQWSTKYYVTLQTTAGVMKKVDLRQQFVLKSVSAGVATIEVETQVLTPLNDPSIEAQIIQHMSSGTLKFDIDAGRVISQVIDLDRRVIGFSGPASSMHYLTRVEEKLLPATPSTARKLRR